MHHSSTRKSRFLAIATAAAALFASAPVVTVQAGEAIGHCNGVNACKGHSSCKTAENACGGHNACKGKGFVVVDEETCGQLGGTFSNG